MFRLPLLPLLLFLASNHYFTWIKLHFASGKLRYTREWKGEKINQAWIVSFFILFRYTRAAWYRALAMWTILFTENECTWVSLPKNFEYIAFINIEAESEWAYNVHCTVNFQCRILCCSVCLRFFTVRESVQAMKIGIFDRSTHTHKHILSIHNKLWHFVERFHSDRRWNQLKMLSNQQRM